MTTRPAIGVIGLGSIGALTAEALAKAGFRLHVSERSRSNSSALAQAYANVTVADNQAVVDPSEIVILATTGVQAPEALSALKFRPEHRVISLMAELNMSEVALLVAPARVVARMLPFPSIAMGGSPILCIGDTALIETLFGAQNTVFALNDEAELGLYLCGQAVLSPVAQLVKVTAEWIQTQGVDDPATAESFLRLLITSSLKNANSSDLLKALDTPGGYNQRMLQALRADGLDEATTAALDQLKG